MRTLYFIRIRLISILYFMSKIILFISFVLGIIVKYSIICNILHICYSLLNMTSDFILQVTDKISFFMLPILIILILVYIFTVCMLLILSLLIIVFNLTIYKFYLKLLDIKCLRSYFNYLIIRYFFTFNKVLLVYLGHKAFPQCSYVIWHVDFHYFIILSVLVSPFVVYALYSIKDNKDLELSKKKYIISVITSLLMIFTIKLALSILLINYPILSEILLYSSILCKDVYEVNTNCSYVESPPILSMSEIRCMAEEIVPIRPPRTEPFLNYKGEKVLDFDAYKSTVLDPDSLRYVQSNPPGRKLSFTKSVESYFVNLHPPIGGGVEVDSAAEERGNMFNKFIVSTHKALENSKDINIALDRASKDFTAAQGAFIRADNNFSRNVTDVLAYSERKQRLLDLQKKEVMYANLYNYINFCKNDLGPLLTVVGHEVELLDLEVSKYKVGYRHESIRYIWKEVLLQMNERGKIIGRHRPSDFHRSQESYLGFSKYMRNDHNMVRFLDQEKSVILTKLRKKHDQVYWTK